MKRLTWLSIVFFLKILPFLQRKKMGKPKTSSKPSDSSLTNRTKIKGVNFYHDAAKVKQRKMLKSGKATRNEDGKIIKPGAFQSRLASGTQARVQPDRRWFENTRVIGQRQLEAFKEAIQSKLNDPYAFVMRNKKLPMSLLHESDKVGSMLL